MTQPPIVTIDRGTGPPVLLLHGQPGDGASWGRVVDRLADRHRVLAPDRPGYGTTTLEASGMVANADRMAELLRDRGATPATVVGHSWSGGVAVLLAARHPDVVRSLVLVGAVGTPDSVNGLDGLLAADRVGEWLTVAGRVDRALGYLAATLPDEVVPEGWAGVRGRSLRTFVVEQRALMAELPEVTARLGELTVPVAVVVGEWDVVVPPTAARSLARAVPGAELVRVPGVGHFVARDAPDRLAEVIGVTDARARGAGAAGPEGPSGR